MQRSDLLPGGRTDNLTFIVEVQPDGTVLYETLNWPPSFAPSNCWTRADGARLFLARLQEITSRLLAQAEGLDAEHVRGCGVNDPPPGRAA